MLCSIIGIYGFCAALQNPELLPFVQPLFGPHPLYKSQKINYHTKILTKMAILLPTGQWYAPSAVINNAWYCMVLHGIAPSCTVLHHVASEYARVCHSMPEYAKVVHKLSPCHPQVVSKSSLVMPSGTHEASMKPAHRVQ